MTQQQQGVDGVPVEPADAAPERVAREMRRMLGVYLLHESAVARHAALFDRVCRAHEQSAIVLEALEHARASRAEARVGRERLREAARAQVASLKAAQVPVERVLRAMREELAVSMETPGVSLPYALFDRLGHDVVQWAIEDYYAAA